MTLAYVWTAVALAALGHGFLWTGLVNRLHGWGGPRRLIKGVTALLVGAFVAIPVAIFVRHGPLSLSSFDPFAMPGVASTYLAACAAIGAASLVVKPYIESQRYDGTVLLQWTAECRPVAKAVGRKPLSRGVARLLGNLPGNESLWLSVDRKQLALASLPEELRGLTIAHLSDLHMTGRVERDYYAYLVRQVNNLRPDVIAITGDIVEHESCWPWLETLGELCAPLGVYFILGNHDGLIDANRTRTLLVEAGLTCLSGRSLRADWNGAPVRLVGNELPWLRPDMPLALPRRAAAGPREFRLVLCHTPDQFPYCVEAEADLALAGHTHGGQIQLPWLGVIMSPSFHGTRYACGVFRRGGTVLHVSRGLGGDTPVRWRCPPELALLELVSATKERGSVTAAAP